MIQIIPTTYQFKQPAGTSRGVYTTRKVWYLHLTSSAYPGRVGIGECAPLPGLSCDYTPDYEQVLAELCGKMDRMRKLPVNGCELRQYLPKLCKYPSILFGLETAIAHIQAGSYALWDTPFSRGEEGIPINGLIWMGDYTNMLRQIESKMQSGYRCIKLKIGAIDFEEELALLRHIRTHFSAREVELRVDANGAFSPAEALDKLKRLAELDLHSIEQPIRAGQWEEMARLTASTPLPIALDEELIGYDNPAEKRRLLKTIRPQYIVTKPSLHGGFFGCEKWLLEACRQDIGWWVTSALETNIGLNAIAQWSGRLYHSRSQGLGTGQLFTENVEMPLEIRGDSLWWNG